MKLTNGEIFQAKEPLGKLLGERLPVLVSYHLAQMALKLNEQFQVIEEVRRGLILRYGNPNPKDSSQMLVTEDSKDYPKFVKELDELMALETEFVIQKVLLPTEVDGKPFQIEPTTLMDLDKFVGVSGG